MFFKKKEVKKSEADIKWKQLKPKVEETLKRYGYL